ncbi:MAG TPA: GNAT family N-acetyltransferase [Gaiellaceae bacterium]|nr:GNAT family N-acetyltransferase [Gaiellaceae bacterium]
MEAAEQIRAEALPVYVETISDEAGFTELAGSWDELVRTMPRPSPFLLHSWLLQWWRHYGRGAALAVHVAYRGDHLVGALPLCTRRRSGLRVSEFVGGTWAILADALVAPGEDAQAVVAALAARAVEGEHDFADLFGLPGSSRLLAALPQGSLRLVQRLEAPVCDLGPSWEAAYTSRLSSKTRSERRRRLRQLEKLGTVESEVARSKEEIARAVEDAFVVHELRWRGRRDASGFITETGKRFHRAALLALADQDVARGLTIRLDGRPIAFSLYLQLAGRSYGLNMAFDPAYAPYGAGSEAKLQAIEASWSEGVRRIEMLGTAAEHKRRFTDRFEPVYEGIGLARTRRGRAATGAVLAGIRLRRALKRSKTARRIYNRAPRVGPG